MRTLIQYRTIKTEHRQFVILPDIFVASMMRWLSDYECAYIVHTESTDKLCLIPQHYPQYKECVDYIRTLNLLTETL